MTKHKKSFWNPFSVITGVVILLAGIGYATVAYLQDKNVAVLNPQGVVAEQERDLIVFTLLLSIIVVVPVYVMLFLFAWRYREKGPRKGKYTPNVGGNRLIEGIWWGIPIAIIGVLSVVTWVSTHQLDPYRALDSSEEPLRVQVVALQWKWLFLYPDYHVASLNELNIPANVPVNFEITADGPMAAFWVPNLGSQVYAMTGMTSQLSLMANKAGVYRGSNSNITGEGYSDMNFNVHALQSRSAFEQWAKSIVGNICHNKLHWDDYGMLAKPNTVTDVAYYHVHDDSMYSNVIAKYMSGSMHGTHGDMMMNMTNADEHSEHGGKVCGEG